MHCVEVIISGRSTKARPGKYDRIAEKVMAFSRGWMKIHNPDSVNKVTDRLPPYEFSLAMMVARGKSNQEIADYRHITVNTVKFHLSGIYQKVEIIAVKYAWELGTDKYRKA